MGYFTINTHPKTIRSETVCEIGPIGRRLNFAELDQLKTLLVSEGKALLEQQQTQRHGKSRKDRDDKKEQGRGSNKIIISKLHNRVRKV